MTDEELQQANGALLKKRAALQAARTQNKPSAIGDSMPSPNMLPDGRPLFQLRLRKCVCGKELPFQHQGPQCASCRKIDEDDQRKRELEYSLANVTDAMMDSDIPDRYCNDTWEIPHVAMPYVDSARGLCLTGPSGTGKTTALCLLMRDHRRGELTKFLSHPSVPLIKTAWKFISFPKLIIQLQDLWRRGESEDTAGSVLMELSNVKRLIIDDLGAEKLTDYARQSTYFLINEREQWDRLTYITTNFSLAQLDEQLDSRISSRIAGMCDVKALTGKDLRMTAERGT